MGLSFPICTISQLSLLVSPSSDHLWIYPALYTAQSSKNLEPRGAGRPCVYIEKPMRLIAGQRMMPVKGQEGDGLTLCHGHEWYLFLNWNLALLKGTRSYFYFISIQPQSFKYNDMPSRLENPFAHPHAYKKGWEGKKELTFQYHFFQNVHEVLLGNATQGCELWLCYQFQQLWIKIEVARLRIEIFFSSNLHFWVTWHIDTDWRGERNGRQGHNSIKSRCSKWKTNGGNSKPRNQAEYLIAFLLLTIKSLASARANSFYLSYFSKRRWRIPKGTKPPMTCECLRFI